MQVDSLPAKLPEKNNAAGNFKLKLDTVTMNTLIVISFHFKLTETVGGSDGKEFSYNGRDLGSVPGLVSYPGGEHGNPLQSSCLENPHGQRGLAGYSP